MQNDSLQVVSNPGYYSIHAYFDICPESPDGKRVVTSRFTDGWPGRKWEAGRPGEVVVHDLDSGSETVVGRFGHAAGHSGPYAQWVDAHHVCYQDGAVLKVADVRDGSTNEWAGGLQSWHPHGGGLYCPQCADPDSPEPDGLYRIDLESGRSRQIVSIDQLRDFCDNTGVPADRSDWLCHAKWSPAGNRVAVLHRVLWTPEKGEVIMRIFTCRPDGSDLKLFHHLRNGHHHKPLHWHWYDEESLYGYDMVSPGHPCRRWTLDGDPIEILHEGPGNHAALSPDHRLIVSDTFYGQDPQKLFLYPVGEKKPRILFEGPPLSGTDSHPVFSRDGHFVYANAALETHGPSVVLRLPVE